MCPESPLTRRFRPPRHDLRRIQISADGSRVAFLSDGDNLVAEDDNAVTNAFVRDLGQGVTTFINRAGGPAGTT